MFKCSYCGQKNGLVVCSKCNTIVCDACHKTIECDICSNNTFYKIYKEDINGVLVDFISLKKFSIGFSGFDRIENTLMEIINSINQIEESIGKNKIILFPNKIESIKFAQKFDPDFFRDEKDIVKKSKFSYLVTPDTAFNLLNFENVKSNEIIFLIKLLILERAVANVEQEYERYRKIIYNSLKILNERIGIDKVSFTIPDEHAVKVVFNNCYKDFHSYIAYKKLLKEYPLDLFNYLQYKIESSRLNYLKVQDFFDTETIFDLFMHVLELKLIEMSVKGNNKIHSHLSKKINEKIEESFSVFKNDDLRTTFNIFISDLEIQNFDKYECYVDFIEASINNICRQIPLIFMRYWEVYGILEESHQLIDKAQSMILEYPGINIIPNFSEMLEFIFKIDRILSFEIPTQYRIILLNAKFTIFKEIVIRNADKTFFDLLLKTNKELEELFLQNYSQLKKDKLFYMDFCDILINYGAVALIYYIFNDVKNAKKIFRERRRYLDIYDVPDFLKISMLFANFQFFENYDDLKEIHKICLNYSQSEEEDHDDYFENINMVVCNFSSYFSDNKGDFLEILNLIKDQMLIPSPFIKNIFEKQGLEIFMAIFYHIINATKQDSTVLLISEVEKALELAELQNDIQGGRDPNDYYLLKTRAIIEIL